MANQTRTFLTVAQALDAVQKDFEHYPAQLTLFTVLVPLAFGDDAYLIRQPGKPTVWIKTPDLRQPHPLEPERLGSWIVQRLKQASITPKRLARICSQVFQAPAMADGGSQGVPGVWIDTGMQDFVCVQCGHCCRTLNYRDGCRVADYRRWQRLGRDDIIRWVGTVHRDGRLVACRIWMQPGTNRYAPVCPWLKRSNEPQRYRCAIHHVRPAICRQYPGSRKHARMTGCDGV